MAPEKTDKATKRKTMTAFRLEPEILDGLRTVKERDGIPVSEQVRRALVLWLRSRRVTVRPHR